MTDVSMNICETQHNTNTNDTNNTNINNTNPIDAFTRQSCFKIKQIVEDLEKKLAKRYNIPENNISSSSQNPTPLSPAGVQGSIIDNSYRNWVGSLRQ